VSRSETVERIKRAGVIAIIRVESAEQASNVADALRQGAVTVIEVTMTVPGAIDVVRSLVARAI
jgi:2-dehydro-3-deoxyphosphogluconate aldolase/(4S)-4-hydroxy-2-oxoglutarate aldolase